MNHIRPTDADFRICQVDLKTLVELQLNAEARGWSTRWSSVERLRSQVSGRAPVLMQSFLRQHVGGGVQTCRCLVLYSTLSGEPQGGVATFDVDPARLARLPRIDRDPDVRSALVEVFRLTSGRIAFVPKT